MARMSPDSLDNPAVEPRAITRRYEKRDRPVTTSSESPSDRAFSSARAGVLEGQDGDPEAFVGAGRARAGDGRRGAWLRRVIRNLQPRLAESVHQRPGQPWIEPLAQQLAGHVSEVLLLCEEVSQGIASGRDLPKLAEGGREQHVRPEDIRCVGLQGFVHCGAVIGQPVLVDGEDCPVPAWMLRVELHRSADQGAATDPVAREGDEEDGLVACVERVEGNRPFRGAPASRRLFAEEQNNRQGLFREWIGRGEVHGAPSGRKRTVERAGSDVEAVGVLVGVDPREHRPAVRVGRRAIDGPLQRVTRVRVLGGSQALVIPEAAHQRFIGAEAPEAPCPARRR